MARFAESVRRFRDRANKNAETYFRALTTSVLAELVRLSPVGDPERWRSGRAPDGYVGGHFRANWQVGINQSPSGTIEGVDPVGTETLSRGASTASGLRIGDRVYLTNNVPYARRIEYGWSDQAPAGVVRITAARFGEIARRAGASIRS